VTDSLPVNDRSNAQETLIKTRGERPCTRNRIEAKLKGGVDLRRYFDR
jgi:hypothetical protein